MVSIEHRVLRYIEQGRALAFASAYPVAFTGSHGKPPESVRKRMLSQYIEQVRALVATPAFEHMEQGRPLAFVSAYSVDSGVYKESARNA